MMHPTLRFYATGVFVALCTSAMAVEQSATRAGVVSVASRSSQTGTTSSSAAQSTTIDQADQFAAQVWGLSLEEIQRAKQLLKGPRASFSIPNLSPIEVLGIHARSDAERRKYAEMFARAQHADTERVLAWAMAYQEAMQRFYPNEKVIDFGSLPKANVSQSAAEAANVPRSAIQPSRPGGRQ
jgi:hypothetical protein